MSPMSEDEHDTNAASPPASDLQLSEGKSLSFLATNIAGPIDLGGLPPVNGDGDSPGTGSGPAKSDPPSGDAHASPESE